MGDTDTLSLTKTILLKGGGGLSNFYNTGPISVSVWIFGMVSLEGCIYP